MVNRVLVRKSFEVLSPDGKNLCFGWSSGESKGSVRKVKSAFAVFERIGLQVEERTRVYHEEKNFGIFPITDKPSSDPYTKAMVDFLTHTLYPKDFLTVEYALVAKAKDEKTGMLLNEVFISRAVLPEELGGMAEWFGLRDLSGFQDIKRFVRSAGKLLRRCGYDHGRVSDALAIILASVREALKNVEDLKALMEVNVVAEGIRWAARRKNTGG